MPVTIWGFAGSLLQKENPERLGSGLRLLPQFWASSRAAGALGDGGLPPSRPVPEVMRTFLSESKLHLGMRPSKAQT